MFDNQYIAKMELSDLQYTDWIAVVAILISIFTAIGLGIYQERSRRAKRSLKYVIDEKIKLRAEAEGWPGDTVPSPKGTWMYRDLPDYLQVFSEKLNGIGAGLGTKRRLQISAISKGFVPMVFLNNREVLSMFILYRLSQLGVSKKFLATKASFLSRTSSLQSLLCKEYRWLIFQDSQMYSFTASNSVSRTMDDLGLKKGMVVDIQDIVDWMHSDSKDNDRKEGREVYAKEGKG